MNEFREAFRRPAGDALSRTIRRDELGMFLFQFTEPFHQLVIVTIGNLRVVLNVVKLVVAANLVAEFIDCLLDGCLLGQPFVSWLGGWSLCDNAGSSRFSNLSSWFSTQSWMYSRSECSRVESRLTSIATKSIFAANSRISVLNSLI